MTILRGLKGTAGAVRGDSGTRDNIIICEYCISIYKNQIFARLNRLGCPKNLALRTSRILYFYI